MHSDPIADMATRMRNAQSARHSTVLMPYSKVKEAILQLLKSKKYISDYAITKEGKFEELKVSFNEGRDNLTITRLSKPGHRLYRAADELPRIRRGMGMLVVSTSAGIMGGYEAFKKGIGGEVLLEVY